MGCGNVLVRAASRSRATELKKPFTGTFSDPNASDCLAGRPPRTTCAFAEGVVGAEMQGNKEAGGPEEHGTANEGSDTSMVEVDEAANRQNDTSTIEADESEAGKQKCRLPLPGRVRKQSYVEKTVRQRDNQCCQRRSVDYTCEHKAHNKGCYWCIGP